MGKRQLTNMSSKYFELNDLLCESIFSAEKSLRPAYVEIDEPVEGDLMEYFECKSDEIRKNIAQLVSKRITETGSEQDPFLGIHKNLINWRKSLSQNISNYPELPLLLVFTFAAVDMGGDGKHDPNAYYPRLHELLKINENFALADSYRSFSSDLWGSLNYWLDVVHNGRYGIGTAYSLGSLKHVGFPLSQALIRSTDRKKLPRLFRRNGFSAFSSIVEKDIDSVSHRGGSVTMTLPDGKQHLFQCKFDNVNLFQHHCVEITVAGGQFNGACAGCDSASG